MLASDALQLCAGCVNSNFGGLLGQSRIFVTMGRAGLLPKGLVSADTTVEDVPATALRSMLHS